jgi:hypothetical protein
MGVMTTREVIEAKLMVVSKVKGTARGPIAGVVMAGATRSILAAGHGVAKCVTC